MNMLYLKEILTTIKEDRKKITQQVKSDMVKSSENFNSVIQGLIDFIGQKNNIEKDIIVDLQNEVLEIINAINNTKVNSFKDCKNIIRLRTKFNYLVNRFKNVIKDIDIPQELSDEFNISLGMYRKSISEYLRVIKRQKNIQYIQLAVNLKKLTPEVEKELIKVIRNEKRFNKNWNNSKNPKSNDCQLESSTTIDVIKMCDQFKTYSSSLSKLSEYLEKVSIKECITIIKIQKNIVELVTEMTNTELNSDDDKIDKINKLRDKFNYQVRKIKSTIKDIDIPQKLSDEYDLSLTLFRKTMSNYLRDVKKQNEINTSLSENNDSISVNTQNEETKNNDDIVNENSFENNIEIDSTTYESIRLVEKLDLFNHDLDRLVSYFEENDIEESSFVVKCQKTMFKCVRKISNIEPSKDNEDKINRLKREFSYQISMIGNIISRLDIPQGLINEFNSSLSLLTSAINKYININKIQDNNILSNKKEISNDYEAKRIDKVETTESDLNNSDSVEKELNEDQNDSIVLGEVKEKSLKEILEILKEGLKNKPEDIIGFETGEFAEKSSLAVSYKDSTFPSLSEVIDLKEMFTNIQKKTKEKLVIAARKSVATGLSITMLTSFLNHLAFISETHNTTLLADNYENYDQEVVEESDTEVVEEDNTELLNNSLTTSSGVEVESLESNLTSNLNQPTIDKAYFSKSDAIFKQNIVTIQEMSYVFRERETLTKEQLDLLLEYICDYNSISNAFSYSRDEALEFLYSNPERTYEEKMLIIMVRENLKYNELDEYLASMTYEGGPDNYKEGYNCSSTGMNRCNSIAWTRDYDASLYSQLTREGQFMAWQNDLYIPYLSHLELPGYQGAIDALYTMEPSHDYLNFNEKSGEEQLTEDGNFYSNRLTDDQRIENVQIQNVRSELEAERPFKFEDEEEEKEECENGLARKQILK